MIVFCITCKNRTQHLERTLPKNLIDNKAANSKFVILDYGSEDNLLEYLRSNHQEDIDSGKLSVYSLKNGGPFRMAHAKNLVHRLGILEGGDILVNLDADNFTGRDFDLYISEKMTTETFLWSGVVKGLGKKFRGCSGRIVVTKDQFLLVGGYDEDYETWGPDDKDFNARLVRLGFKAIEMDRAFLEAIPHKDGVRFKEYPHIQGNLEDENEVIISEETVVNYGSFGCGTVYKNFSNIPTVLGPVPTRIFGIGLHKTATTSLNAALGILGYKSGHWESGDWAKTVFEEIRSTGKSKALESYYVLSDLPIPLLYKELDHNYPGSKFILTTRDETKWIESIRKHWSYQHNRFRWEWDKYPFSNRIHKELYGRKDFNRDIFLARYHKHNYDVVNYFKNRPNDLLVMDMEKAGWPELCKFLGNQIPDQPYPRKLISR